MTLTIYIVNQHMPPLHAIREYYDTAILPESNRLVAFYFGDLN